MTNSIGEILLENDKLLLKMWSIDVLEGKREFVKHSHTRFEIAVVINGSGEYSTENAVYPMLPGDVFVFSSNEIHCITNIKSSRLSIINLHFEPRYLLEKDLGNFGENYVNFCFSHSAEFQNRIPSSKAGIIRKNHTMIKNELITMGLEHQHAIKSYLDLILIDLLRNHKYPATNTADKNDNYSKILSVYDYIDKHLNDDLTLDNLAKIANLSPNYLSHIFKQLNGVGLWDYIIAKRVEKAARMLCDSNSNRSILDVAIECGFNNTANFNKAFKKLKNITPSQLRKNPKLLSH